MRSAKNIYRRRSRVFDTVGHAPLAIDRLLDSRTTKWEKQLPTTMQCRSHSRRLTSECLWRPAAWTNTPKRREQKRLYAVVYLKPKQLIIKDCARRFVLKLYRHEASCGLFATAEILVENAIWSYSVNNIEQQEAQFIAERPRDAPCRWNIAVTQGHSRSFEIV